MILPPPHLILGEGQFTEWYPGQEDAISAIYEWLQGTDRFMGLSAPTGSGKSIIAVIASRLSQMNTRILTHTKGLQDQLMHDFDSIGMTDIRGQNNYSCNKYRKTSVDEAPCHTLGQYCSLKEGGCAYYDQLKIARKAPLVTTNYAAWVSLHNYTQDFNADLLICDEASTAFSAMESFMTITLTREYFIEIGVLPPKPDNWDWNNWQNWFRKNEIQGSSVVKRKWHSTRQIILNSPAPWAIEVMPNGSFVFTPVWISAYKPFLFGDTRKVLLMSADLTPNDCYLLGIAPEELSWYDMPSTFPAGNTPIHHIKTCPVTYNMTEDNRRFWVSRIDQIIAQRPDSKGIVFPVSYRNADYINSNSHYQDRLMGHTRYSARKVIKDFQASPYPKVLNSPAATVGYNFPGDMARFLVVAKLPWPVTQTEVFKLRKSDDKEYVNHVIAKSLVQACGRATRSPSDWSEVFITDDQMLWWWNKYHYLTPSWFQARYKGTVESLPAPLTIK